MRRAVLMLGLAGLAAAVLPLPADAGDGGPPPAPVASAASEAVPFTLGGQPCSLIPVPATNGAPPVATGLCPGVRPGGALETDVGLCTFNFLFRAPDGTRYIGTAGHCILASGPLTDEAGEKLWPKGAGPVAMTGGERIGEFAYAVLKDPMDFALIRLDPNVEASPEMCHFGGPTGILEGLHPNPVVLEYWGNGVGVGTFLPGRSGLAAGMPHPDHVYGVGVALPGDSGSGVITSDGQAVGVLVTTGLHGFGYDENGLDFGTIGITRLGPQLVHAQQALGTPLQLVTAG